MNTPSTNGRALRRVLLLLLITLGPGLAYGQETFRLRIFTRDAVTGDHLPFVSAQIVDGPQGTTDADGAWEVRLPTGQVTILTSAIGYASEPYEIGLRANRDLVILMDPFAETLETITVSTDDARERQLRPLMGVKRLSTEDLKVLPTVLGEVDVLRSLQTVSGVSSAGEVSNGVSVRGGMIDQNLILFDGAPIFTPTHLFGLFSIFTPDAVGGVDLYRGNIPARFGGRLSSVVNVQSKEPTRDKWLLRGGLGILSSNLSLEGPVTKDKRLKVLIAARGAFNDLAFKAIERLKNTESKFGDGIVKLRYALNDRHSLSASGFYSKDFYSIDLLSNFAGISADRNQYDYSTLNGSLNWLYVVNERLNVSTRLVSSDHKPNIIFPQREGGGNPRYGSRIQFRSVQSTADLTTANDHHLSGGFQLTRYDLDPGFLDPDGASLFEARTLAKEAALETSLFIEDEWRVSDKLRLSLGLRYTRFDQLAPGSIRSYAEGEELTPFNLTDVTEQDGGSLNTFDGWEPRAGLSFQVGQYTNLKASYGITRQYLLNIYNAVTPLPTSRWKVADNNVAPQRGDIVSLGLHQLTANGAFEFNLEGYYRRMQNQLEYKPGADFFLTPFVETDILQGQSRAYGVELSVEEHKGPLTARMSYTYARVENRVEGPTFRTSINNGEWYNGYFDQPHNFNISLSAKDNVANTFNLSLTVQSNRPYTVPNGFVLSNGLSVPLYLERNNGRLPVYHRLDFSWRIHNPTLGKRRWTGDWIFTVYNLYGRKNTFNNYFVPITVPLRNGNISTSPLRQYRLSIFGAPVVSLTYQFKFE